jgi:hypothetical protein
MCAPPISEIFNVLFNTIKKKSKVKHHDIGIDTRYTRYKLVGGWGYTHGSRM